MVQPGQPLCRCGGFCKAASLAEVEANGYVISPGRYVGSEAEEDDGVPFEDKMKALTEVLAKQFAEGECWRSRLGRI